MHTEQMKEPCESQKALLHSLPSHSWTAGDSHAEHLAFTGTKCPPTENLTVRIWQPHSVASITKHVNPITLP